MVKDLFDRVKERRGPLGKWMDVAEGYYMFPELEGEISAHMMFQGKEVLCWSLNNYMGLGNHPEVRKVDAQAAAQYGLAYPMGARMMSGQSKYHRKFEKDLANFVDKKYGYVVNFGYQGILSTIDALLDRHDVAVYDSDCHASIMDGLRMSPAKRFSYAHNNIEDCDKKLALATKAAEEQGGAVLLITEGVFGMRGMMGKLKEICELKKKYKFRILIDDAHGFGAQGPNGKGAAEAQGCQNDIDIYFATFAKSMAMIGGFVAADDRDIIRHLQYNMRSQIYAKSMPMAMVIGGMKRLELLKDSAEDRKKLWDNVHALQNGLRERGFDIGNMDSCVTPVYLKGSIEEATWFVNDLRENYHIFCSIVIPPVIPKGLLLLRLIPTCYHSKEDIEYTLDTFSKLKAKLEAGEYKSDHICPIPQYENELV